MITLLTVTLRMSTSLLLASLGGTISERSGVVNIGLEGMMLVGAFMGVLGSHYTGSAWLGILFAMIGGGLMGLLHAFLCVTLKSNQPISSMGINILGLGITSYGVRTLFKALGATPKVPSVNTTPFLAFIPKIGTALAELPSFVYISIILAILMYVFLFRTPVGLRLRAVGENPGAADSMGISVVGFRYLSVITSGVFAGLAGAYISLGQLNLFQENMTSGRGYIALAVVILARWNPLGCIAASLLFGFADALQFKLQIIPGNPVPGELMLIMPYLLTLLVVLAVKRVRSPAALGIYYDRSNR